MMLCLKLTLLTLLIAAPGLLVAQGTVTTCDGDVLSLSCGTKVIRVLNTEYGRRDSNTCPPPHSRLTATNTNCGTDVTTIADRCNGLQYCEVKTNLLTTNDPCPGTYKYYTTVYECIDGKNLVVCEPNSATLNCGSDTIDILNANFGIADSATCTNGNPHNSKICYTPDVFSNLESQCDGQTTCTVQATSTYTFSGACKNAAKSLSVSYRCLKSITTCKPNTANLNCGALKIEIISAFYGRKDTTTCSSGYFPSQVSNTNCQLPSALSKVQNSCDGLSTCNVPATNAFFTNPCYGTIEYLVIVYACV